MFLISLILNIGVGDMMIVVFLLSRFCWSLFSVF